MSPDVSSFLFHPCSVSPNSLSPSDFCLSATITLCYFHSLISDQEEIDWKIQQNLKRSPEKNLQSYQQIQALN